MKNRKLRMLAFCLAVLMIMTVAPFEVIALDEAESTESTYVPYEEGSAASTTTGLKDYSMPSNDKHAYDPFAQLESEEETAAYRASVQYEAGRIIYKVNETKGWFGGYRDEAEADALVENGIDLAGATELSRKKVDDGFFTDTYEVIYVADLDGDVWETIDALAEIEGVVDAQPNYLYEDTAIDVPTNITTNPDKDKQWYHGPDHLDCDKHWQHMYDDGITAGEGAIVAVIDTGVDYTHIDLAANMWVNTAEFNGIPGVDDDGNGYIDDIHGVSTVGAKPFHSGDPMDDHGHGTHVAGIIAMTANNGEGGVGIAYGTKIMAIKAGQATGVFSDTDIAEAINYAVAMGADVINMSFGGTGKSFLVEEALQNAFGTCVLVAAAGNDGIPTSDAPEDFMKKADFYPAGYSYVIGVMATDQSGNLASFSNWDYYNNGGSAEYELTAPGVDIYSTLPGNQYAYWDGTSMAAPMVAAAAALIRSKYPDREMYSSRFIMGQLASATEDSTYYVDKTGKSHTYAAVNLDDSLNKLPTPNLTVKNTYLFDDPAIAPENDGDGIIDAGETIDLGIVLRNQWGMAGDVTVQVHAISDGGVANPYIEWITDTITTDDIGTFNEQDNGFIYENDMLVGVDNPIRFKVKSDTINDAHIGFHIVVTCSNALDQEDTTVYTFDPAGFELTFFVQRGRTISGTLTEDMTLTADDYWIVENTVVIPEGVTVTVEPGTQIQFWGSDASDPYAQKSIVYIDVLGNFLVNGTEENPVEMFPSYAFQTYGVDIRGKKAILSYTNIINPLLRIDKGDHLYITQTSPGINYRLLSGATVYERGGSYYGGLVSCNTISDSFFTNIYLGYLYGGGTPTTDGDSGLFGDFINSSFCDGVFGTSHTTFTGCSFVNTHKSVVINGKIVNLSSSIATPADGAGLNNKEIISEIFTFGESKYVVIDNLDKIDTWNTNDYAIYSMANNLAKNRGGYLATINSAEEATFLTTINDSIEITFSSRKYLGGFIKKGTGDDKVVWADGVSDYGFPNINLSDDFEWYVTWTEDGGCGFDTWCGSSFIFEYPNTVSDETILASFSNQEVYTAIKQTGDELGLVFDFTNNAVLNNLVAADSEMWTKLNVSSQDVSTLTQEYLLYATNNYWGTTNEELIRLMMVDGDIYAGLADIVTDPILTLESPELENIYPFVTEAYITDSEGNRITKASIGQEIALHVKFNRDMDTSVLPMVSFGPAEPYTDYVVYGEFVSAREWVGVTTLRGVIDAGNEFIRIKDAVAADDAWLKTGTDAARFMFEISNTGAEALTLQAVGGENKVELSWTQDDYDTLAGFNVYRSTAADGTFTKINTRLIPGTIREYVDTDVVPGQEYFYYFTVMGTDLVESYPSNTASATPIDNVKPILTHNRVTSANSGESIAFTATASDNIGVTYVKLFYRAKGTSSYKSIAMSLTEGNTYFGVIPSTEVSLAGVEYYIEISDGVNLVRDGSSQYPIAISVDHSLVLYSVSPSKVDVRDMAEGVTAILTGVNFTDTMTLRVGNLDVEYSLISENQISFTIPEGNLGRADIYLVDGERSAQLTNAITYTDSLSEVQVVSPEEGVAREAIKLPITVTASGEIYGVDLQIKIDRSLFSAVSFEKAASALSAIATCSVNDQGLVKISMASVDAIPTDAPIGYLVLTPVTVTEATSTTVQTVYAELNAVSAATLVDCNQVIKPNFTVSGKVTYYGSSEGVAGVKVTLSNGMVTYTDENGMYTFSGITTNKVTIAFSHSGNVNGAVSAQDASLVLQAITEDGAALTEHQILAADVDGDGKLSALDAAYILQKSVGKIEGNYPGTGAEWLFTGGSQALTLTDDLSGVDFSAILLGDVTGDWTSTPQTELE